MSNRGHHRRKRRKRNAVQVFLDRLRGRDSYRRHRSNFPGIHLPNDYDDGEWKNKQKEITPSSPEEAAGTEDLGRDFSKGKSEVSEKSEYKHVKPTSYRRKKSWFKSIRRYFRTRELRREERMKNKLKRARRRKSQKEYRKMNAGPGLGKRLFTWSDELSDEGKAKKVPLLSQRSPVYRNLTIAINSLMVFMLTYVLVYLFYWLTSMLVASFYGLDSTLYFYDLKFNNHSPLWDRFNILLVTGIPPFFCLFLGLFLYKVLFKNSRFVGLQKLFILWSSFHLFNHFFGALPSGIVTAEGFGYVAAWMYMNTAFKFLFSLVSLFALGVIGFYSAKHILETSDSLHRIKASNRLPFMLYQTAIPWLVGTIIMLLVRIPHNFDYPYETLMFFSMVFLVIPPFFNEKVKPKLNLLKAKKRRTINIGYVAMMIIFLAFLRIMLGIGLHFLIKISISITPAVT